MIYEKPAPKPPLPEWMVTTMRLAAVVFTVLVLAAMAGVVVGVWYWAMKG
jgi:hypothetical protein